MTRAEGRSGLPVVGGEVDLSLTAEPTGSGRRTGDNRGGRRRSDRVEWVDRGWGGVKPTFNLSRFNIYAAARRRWREACSRSDGD